MRYFFHPEAEAEFDAAVDYYEDCEPGLGYDFAVEVHATLENILSFPKAWPILEDDIRRCQTRRFPFGIIYAINEDVIFVLAVMHLHRDPEYWKSRL
ncbi:MAG: type II toxin-antitoxin system RelE/ParE family toxin [Thermodesulfobacteriota bacterium]